MSSKNSDVYLLDLQKTFDKILRTAMWATLDYSVLVTRDARTDPYALRRNGDPSETSTFSLSPVSNYRWP